MVELRRLVFTGRRKSFVLVDSSSCEGKTVCLRATEQNTHIHTSTVHTQGSCQRPWILNGWGLALVLRASWWRVDAAKNEVSSQLLDFVRLLSAAEAVAAEMGGDT